MLQKVVEKELETRVFGMANYFPHRDETDTAIAENCLFGLMKEWDERYLKKSPVKYFAKTFGISEETLTNWIECKEKIPFKWVQVICSLFPVTETELFNPEFEQQYSNHDVTRNTILNYQRLHRCAEMVTACLYIKQINGKVNLGDVAKYMNLSLNGAFIRLWECRENFYCKNFIGCSYFFTDFQWHGINWGMRLTGKRWEKLKIKIVKYNEWSRREDIAIE